MYTIKSPYLCNCPSFSANWMQNLLQSSSLLLPKAVDFITESFSFWSITVSWDIFKRLSSLDLVKDSSATRRRFCKKSERRNRSLSQELEKEYRDKMKRNSGRKKAKGRMRMRMRMRDIDRDRES